MAAETAGGNCIIINNGLRIQRSQLPAATWVAYSVASGSRVAPKEIAEVYKQGSDTNYRTTVGY